MSEQKVVIKYAGDTLFFATDFEYEDESSITGISDLVATVTNFNDGSLVASVTLAEPVDPVTGNITMIGSYRGEYVTTQKGALHVRLKSASIGFDKVQIYEVRPAERAPAQVETIGALIGTKALVSMS